MKTNTAACRNKIDSRTKMIVTFIIAERQSAALFKKTEQKCPIRFYSKIFYEFSNVTVWPVWPLSPAASFAGSHVQYCFAVMVVVFVVVVVNSYGPEVIYIISDGFGTFRDESG